MATAEGACGGGAASVLPTLTEARTDGRACKNEPAATRMPTSTRITGPGDGPRCRPARKPRRRSDAAPDDAGERPLPVSEFPTSAHQPDRPTPDRRNDQHRT